MFLVRAGECVSPNISGLVSRLMGLLFLVAWVNVEVMEGFLWKLYPPAEDWFLHAVVCNVPGGENEVVGLVGDQPPGACCLEPHKGFHVGKGVSPVGVGQESSWMTCRRAR